MDENEKDQNEYESRLRRRLKILGDYIDSGKFKIAEGLTLIDSLKKVMYAPDGTVDLKTVDASVRAAALAVESLHDRQEAKKAIPLAHIQGTYFNILDTNFGSIYKAMTSKNLTPHDAAMTFIQDEDRIKYINEIIPELLKVITDFWTNFEDINHDHLQDLRTASKGVFGGDLFPSNNENIASKCSLYIDTLILPCPFMRSLIMFNHWNPKDKAYYCIKHAMNVLKYKDLAMEPVLPPIIAIMPDRMAINKGEGEFFAQLGREDAVIHGNKIFGTNFKSFEELMDFASSLETLAQAEESVVDKERALFDVDWTGNISDQIQKSIEDGIDLMKTLPPGVIIASQAMGRMSVSNELIIKASRLNGVPIIDAPTSWKYFNWKLEYDSDRACKVLGLDNLHLFRAFQTMTETESHWLGNIPPTALIEIRTSGAADEIRKILGQGISEIIEIDPNDFNATTNRVFTNMNDAIAKHEKAVAELSLKKWKFAGTNIGSWLVSGSVAIAAAATGKPLWSLAPLVANGFLSPAKLTEIPGIFIDLVDETNNLRRSPMGMLFHHKH